MNSRQLSLLLGVALVLGTAGWFLFHRGARSWESAPIPVDQKVLAFPLNDVAHITIKDGSSELNLVKKPDGWAVHERADYPANFEQVSRLLQQIWNLKPVQSLQVGPAQLARLDLLKPAKEGKTGTLLDLKDKDGKRIAALLAGKQYLKKSNQSFAPADFPAGRYVMPEDGLKKVFLVADPLQDFVTKPERWLDHGFVKIEKPKSIALAGTTAAQQWKIQRDNESADWRFASAKPGEEVDKTKAASLAGSVSNLSFSEVLDPAAKPDATGLDKPSTVTVETFDGFIYSLAIGKLSGEKYPLTISIASALPAQRETKPDEKAEDKKKLDDAFAARKKTLEEKLEKEKKFEGRPFLVNKFTIKQLLKNRSDLIKAEPSPAPTPSLPLAPPSPPLNPPGSKTSPTPKAKP
ncbi:MAG: DUF4340 domain-containing protein [Chthoniobacterales bacterium]